MGSDSVIDCVMTGGVVSVQHSYNSEGYQNQLILPRLGLGNGAGSFEDGIFTCAFSRQTVVPSQDKVYDLNSAWHVLFAHGRAQSGLKLPHGSNDVLASRRPIDFGATKPTKSTTLPTTTPTTTTELWTTIAHKTTIIPVAASSKPITVDPAQCGKTQGCYHPCVTDTHCDFAVSWTSHKDGIDFRLKATLSGVGDKWVAIGFSDDEEMGGDYVLECVSKDGDIRVFQSYNYGKRNRRLPDPHLGIRDSSASIIDGVFECNFTRDKVVNGDEKIFDLEKDWHLLYAYGNAVEGKKQPHSYTNLPKASAQAIDLQSYEDISGVSSRILLKVHGCLMVFAWVCAASIGIIAARYYKPLWPHQRACGQMIWFQIHRFCMILAFVACISGFVIIFVEIKGYSEIVGSNFHKAHPILGIIVTALAVLNPIMALFRPHPGTSKRSVFNWAHWIVGTGSHMLGILTIFSGVGLNKVHVPGYVTYILIGYVVYQVLIAFILEIHQYVANKKEFSSSSTANKRHGQYLYEMQGKPYGSTRPPAIPLDIEPPFSNMKKAMLGTHVLIILAFAMIVGLIIAIS
ncbi:hypothetical protein ScPMuIL_005513 [Solemya velum]